MIITPTKDTSSRTLGERSIVPPLSRVHDSALRALCAITRACPCLTRPAARDTLGCRRKGTGPLTRTLPQHQAHRIPHARLLCVDARPGVVSDRRRTPPHRRCMAHRSAWARPDILFPRARIHADACMACGPGAPHQYGPEEWYSACIDRRVRPVRSGAVEDDG